MPSYVPPFRRAAAASTAGEAPSGEAPPPTGPSSQRFNNRGRGPRGGRGGSGRGGFSRQDRRSLDDSDAYSMKDVTNHFWPDEEYVETRDKSSTFHESAAHPEDLSYIFLFSGANPRWQTDGIIFAKSKLYLLPEYKAKKAEHGPWTEGPRRGSGNAGSPEGVVVAHAEGEKEMSSDGMSGVAGQKIAESSSTSNEVPTDQRAAPKETASQDNLCWHLHHDM